MQDSTPPAPPRVSAVETGYDDTLAQVLVAEVQAEYVERYGGPDDSPVEPGQFAPPTGSFLLAWVDGACIGSVALRRHLPSDPPGPADGPADTRRGTAEMKRLYVRADHRRRGYARALLRLAEDRAQALGYRDVVLETGTEQPEAMALYAAADYRPVPTYGHYRCAPQSRCFAKTL